MRKLLHVKIKLHRSLFKCQKTLKLFFKPWPLKTLEAYRFLKKRKGLKHHPTVGISVSVHWITIRRYIERRNMLTWVAVVVEGGGGGEGIARYPCTNWELRAVLRSITSGNKSFTICNRVPNQLSYFIASPTLELSEDAKDQGSYFKTSSTIMKELSDIHNIYLSDDHFNKCQHLYFFNERTVQLLIF